MKIIASDLPASGFLSYLPARMRSASPNRCSSSSREKSGMARKSRCMDGRMDIWAFGRMAAPWAATRPCADTSIRRLENVLAEVLVLHDCLEPIAHDLSVHRDRVGAAIGQVEQHVLEQRRHYGVQAARADVLHALVHQRGDARDLGDAVGREVELRAFRLDE